MPDGSGIDTADGEQAGDDDVELVFRRFSFRPDSPVLDQRIIPIDPHDRIGVPHIDDKQHDHLHPIG